MQVGKFLKFNKVCCTIIWKTKVLIQGEGWIRFLQGQTTVNPAKLRKISDINVYSAISIKLTVI